MSLSPTSGASSETAGPRRRRFTRRKASRPGQGRGRTVRRISLVLFFLLAQLLFLSSHLFRLQEVEVRGNVRLTRAAILRQAALSEGTCLWALSPRRITKRLQGLREVRSVEVSLALPGRVLLEVDERHPVLLVSGNRGTWFEVDAEGILLGPPSGPQTLPRLKLVTLEATQGRIDPTPIRLVLKAKQWLEPNLPAPPTAYMLDEIRSLSVESRLLGTPVLIHVGPLQGMEYKMHVLRALIDRIKSEGRPVVLIDLRYSSPVVRPLKPEPAPGPAS